MAASRLFLFGNMPKFKIVAVSFSVTQEKKENHQYLHDKAGTNDTMSLSSLIDELTYSIIIESI